MLHTFLSLTAVGYIVWEGGWMKGCGIAAYIVVSNSCQLHCGLDEGMEDCIAVYTVSSGYNLLVCLHVCGFARLPSQWRNKFVWGT